MAHNTDHPPLPRSIDRAIGDVRGSTVALDATPEKLAATKYPATPSLKEIVEDKTRENGRLRAELAYLQNMQQIGEELRGEVEYVEERLRLAVVSFRRRRKDLEKAQ